MNFRRLAKPGASPEQIQREIDFFTGDKWGGAQRIKNLSAGSSAVDLLAAAMDRFRQEATEEADSAVIRARQLNDLKTQHSDAESSKNTAVLDREMSLRLQGALEFFANEWEAANNPFCRTAETETQEFPEDLLSDDGKSWFERLKRSNNKR